VEKVDTPYTPRYQLFEECRDISFEDFFLSLFVGRIGRDEPLTMESLPPMFEESLAGKRLADFEDETGQPVNFMGIPFGPEYVTLKQLDDYFLYRNRR